LVFPWGSLVGRLFTPQASGPFPFFPFGDPARVFYFLQRAQNLGGSRFRSVATGCTAAVLAELVSRVKARLADTDFLAVASSRKSAWTPWSERITECRPCRCHRHCLPLEQTGSRPQADVRRIVRHRWRGYSRNDFHPARGAYVSSDIRRVLDFWARREGYCGSGGRGCQQAQQFRALLGCGNAILGNTHP